MAMDANTLEELAALPSPGVVPRVATKFLGGSAYGLNIAARHGQLKLPHFFSGNRLYISKAAILEYCGYNGGPDRREEEERTGKIGWIE